MDKLCIKVSRDASKLIKSLSEDVKEYIGVSINYLVGSRVLDWEDVAKLSGEDLIQMVMETDDVHSLEELECKADNFCWHYGFVGYKIQSRF